MQRDLQKSLSGERIGFVIYYPFQFYFYKNIYQQLSSEAEFIIDLCHNYSTQEQQSLLQAILTLIGTINAPYRVIYPTDYLIHGYLEQFFSTTVLLVSTWEKGCMQHTATTHLKKVRCAYGLGKELTMVRQSGRLYDLTLAHGERDASRFSLLCPTRIVGLPKFDEWFTDSVASLPSNIKASIDNKKPTILYVPTHGDLSSIDALVEPLTKLTSDYNIIAKLHYATAWAETSRVERLRQSGCVVTDDSSDILPLFKSANVVLSDNSSTIFEACLADVPVVVADFWTDDYLLSTHRQGKWYSGGQLSPLTYPDSLEQVIKRDGSVVTLALEGDLSVAIDKALLDPETIKAKRRVLASLFTYTDGQCAARAALAINDCATALVTVPKPILYYALAPQNLMLNEEGKSNRRLSLVNQASEPAVVQCVYKDEVDCSDESTKLNFFSLVTQRYSQKNLQVTVLTGRVHLYESWLKELREKSQLLPQVTISLCTTTEQEGYVLRQCLRSSEATFTLLASAQYEYSGEWITTTVSALERYPDCGAVTLCTQTVSVRAVRDYHNVPKGILGLTMFRSFYAHTFTMRNFFPVWYEMALKHAVLKKDEWLFEKGQATNFVANWYEYGMADAFAFTTIRSFLSTVRYVGTWSTAWRYRYGFLRGLWGRFVHNYF